MDFGLELITGLLIALIIGMVSWMVKPIRNKILEIIPYWELRKAGLRVFLPLDRFTARIDVGKTLVEMTGTDELFIAARTVRWLIERKKGEVLKGLENGTNIKILLLDPLTVKEGGVDLRPLQLRNSQTIDSDLSISLNQFVSICEESRKTGLNGSLEVRTCDFLIFNSLTCLTYKDIRKIVLDFSFSEADSDKYQQYYEWDKADQSHFCNKLYDFYKGFYDQAKIYMRYSGGKLEYGEGYLASVIDGLTSKYLEGERLRNNEPAKLLYLIPDLIIATETRNGTLPNPASVQLELTNRCNTQCRHCRRHSWPNIDEMSTTKAKNIIEELASLRVGSLILSGGEPTLRSDLVEIVSHANQQGLRIGVLTNGLGIDNKLAEALVKYSDWIRISLDGSNPDYYKRIRGSEVGFMNVVETIKTLAEARLKVGVNNYKIGVCYTIQRLNIDDVTAMINCFKGLHLSQGLDSLTFKFVHGRNGFLCDEKQLYQFYHQILEQGRVEWDESANLKYLKKFMETYSSIEDIASGMPMRTYFAQHKIRCFTPYLFSLIDAFGDVYPCCFLYYDNDDYSEYQAKRKQYVVGNLIDTGTFHSVWTNDKYNKIRDDLITIGKFDECKECTRHYLHNTFITEVFTKYYSSLEEMGSAGASIFKHTLRRYPPCSVWL